MRRIGLFLLIAVLFAAFSDRAEAGHGHWHRGWHGGHWHRHGGWAPYRYGGYWGGWGGLSVSFGYPGYGFAGYGFAGYPAYGYGYHCYPPLDFCPPLLDGCYGYSGLTFGVYPSVNRVRYLPRANYVEYNLDTSYEPAELAYGPLAVKQFLGLDRNFALGPLRQPAPLLADSGKTVRLKVRTSNAESRRRADRYMAQGDELFLKHNWHSALQKYKLAGQLAPDVAECFWRQGHALVAVNQFGQAADAFRRALLLNEDTGRGGFRLSTLYADSEAAKNSHLEALAAEALRSTISSDAYFLIGITLHYHGEPERAQKFLTRAAELSSEDARLVEAFRAPEPSPGLPSLVLPVKTEETEI